MAVKQTPHGTWQARWRDAAGQQHARSFRRKIDADQYERDTLSTRDAGLGVDRRAGRITLKAWADQWLDSARNLGPGGLDTYRRDLDRYILPELGAFHLNQLTADHIDAYLSTKLETLAASTVHRHYRTLHRMLEVAVQRRKLALNPTAPVEPPRLTAVEMRFLTAAEVEALADVIAPRYRAWVLTAAYAGPRWSEAMALRPEDLDGRTLAISTQRVRRNGSWDEREPKTRAGRRRVTIPQSLQLDLAAHIEAYPAPRLFTTRNGTTPQAPSFTGNTFKGALRRAGLDPAVRIHDLRHTAVALAIAAGAHPKAIQSRMGHASISVTLDRYGHLYPDVDEAVADALDGLRTNRVVGPWTRPPVVD